MAKVDPNKVKGTPALAKPMQLKAPEQGYSGPDVKHIDGETQTDDWQKELQWRGGAEGRGRVTFRDSKNVRGSDSGPMGRRRWKNATPS